MNARVTEVAVVAVTVRSLTVPGVPASGVVTVMPTDFVAVPPGPSQVMV